MFDDRTSLKRLVSAVNALGNCIVGIAGSSHAKKKDLGGGLFSAETLDECCVAMPRVVWEKYKFNEDFCDGWHLYVVELCLRSQGKIQIACGEFGIRHLSIGNVDEAYMKKFRQLLLKYKDRKWIYTTCKKLPTNMVIYHLYYFMWKIKKVFFGNIPILYKLKQKVRV